MSYIMFNFVFLAYVLIFNFCISCLNKLHIQLLKSLITLLIYFQTVFCCLYKNWLLMALIVAYLFT